LTRNLKRGAMSCASLAKRPEGFGAALCAGSFAESETARVLPEAKLQKHRALWGDRD